MGRGEGRRNREHDFITKLTYEAILNSQVVSLPLQSVIPIKVANFCAAMDTLTDQDDMKLTIVIVSTLK